MDQVNDYEEERQLQRKPVGTREILEWEIQTGKLYKDCTENFSDEKNKWGDTDLVAPMTR